MNILFTFLIRGISWGNKLRLSMRKILKISFYLLLAVSTVVFNACSNGEDDELGNKSDGKQENTFIPDRIIDVEYAGTLKDYISEADMFRIKSLRVTGVLNGTDIDFLQRMIGDKYNEKNGVLENLDISDAKIVSGGLSYYTHYPNIGEEIEYKTSYDEIGGYMFYAYPSLKTILLPNNIKEIGTFAFYACSGLTSITIPETVTYIDRGAFSYCINLKSVYMERATPPGTEPQDYFPFIEGVHATLYVPRGSSSAYKNSWWHYIFKNIVEYDK